MSTFGFKFDSSKVQAAAFEDGTGSQYPIVVWHGKYSGSGSESGFWTVDRDNIPTAPGPFWLESTVQYGTSPNAPFEPVWKTERLRVCVIGMRKRIIITTPAGVVHTYPWLTKKELRQSGDYKAHFQIAVMLPESDQVFQISLKGVSKTKAWSNPESGRYRDNQYPTGVELVLREYAALASRELNAKVPAFCSFWIDLVPVTNEKGQKTYVDAGYGTHVSIFRADMSTGGSTGLETRFVGMESFLRFQDIRQSEILEWERVWNKAGTESESAAAVDIYTDTGPEPDWLRGVGTEPVPGSGN